MKQVLKSGVNLKQKPNLKLYPNHYETVNQIPGRIWWSMSQGTAYSDGKGWYRDKP